MRVSGSSLGGLLWARWRKVGAAVAARMMSSVGIGVPPGCDKLGATDGIGVTRGSRREGRTDGLTGCVKYSTRRWRRQPLGSRGSRRGVSLLFMLRVSSPSERPAGIRRRSAEQDRMNTAARTGVGKVPDYKIWQVILASAVGTMIEWYDFYIFGSLATVIAPLFYPKGNDTLALIAYLSTFAVGFMVRPFGALFFGRLGGLVGRKYAFLVTLLIMGGATA